jgi:hypothetical protein
MRPASQSFLARQCFNPNDQATAQPQGSGKPVDIADDGAGHRHFGLLATRSIISEGMQTLCIIDPAECELERRSSIACSAARRTSVCVAPGSRALVSFGRRRPRTWPGHGVLCRGPATLAKIRGRGACAEHMPCSLRRPTHVRLAKATRGREHVTRGGCLCVSSIETCARLTAHSPHWNIWPLTQTSRVMAGRIR